MFSQSASSTNKPLWQKPLPTKSLLWLRTSLLDSNTSFSPALLSKNLDTMALFGFFFLITHHSSLNFRHSSLITNHSSLITNHPSLITHHSLLKTPHPVWHYHSLVITQYFSTVCGTHPLTQCQLTFLSLLLFFFPASPLRFSLHFPLFFSAFLFIHVNTYFNQAHHNPYFHTFPRSTI